MVAQDLYNKVCEIARTLDREHGTAYLGNKPDPLDEMVYIALTRQTHERNAQSSWLALTSRYTSWRALLEASEDEVAATIARGGFSSQKARWIKRSLELIEQAFGTLSLAPLADMSDQHAEGFLCTLPGINQKSAKCILMYSLGRQVLPVDTHVMRLSERLGLVSAGLSPKRIHQELESTVPREWHHSYHVNAVVHGRAVCTVRRPRCGECVVRHLCDYYRSDSEK